MEETKSDKTNMGLDSEERGANGVFTPCQEERIKIIAQYNLEYCEFSIARRAVVLSDLLQTLVEDARSDVNKEGIRLAQPPELVGHVIRYLEHHNGKKPEKIKRPLQSPRMIHVCEDKWNVEFINQLAQGKAGPLLLRLSTL